MRTPEREQGAGSGEPLTQAWSRGYARRESAPSRNLSPTPDRRHRRTFGPVKTLGGRVPVTARLSKRFYDVFGEEIANELVNWFNQVDDTYRTDLRELNELNFSRFDAKLEQRLAELDAKWGGRWTQLDAKLEQRLAELDAKWGGRWTQLDAKLGQRLAESDARWEQRIAELRVEIQKTRADLVKWMFAFWAPTALGVIGTGAGVVSLLLRR